uniref:Cytochrome c oxidase subunit 2 n=1 Tax=Hydatigera parva TaxID=1434711 RepID=N0DP32_9CEST|nr:cytochrome c oxidase subunit II [Hydatigera parva]BAN15663.1 cytochrome c oxidase subunit 2 [Hydatigera parva]
MNLSLLYYDIVCYIIAVCVFILCFVYIMLFWNLFMNSGSVNFGGENQTVELLWTVVPTMVVLILCSLNVNFITSDLDCFSSETIKIVGHQWYWSYEYSDGVYDSFLSKDCFLVDKPLRMFYSVPYHLIVTSADVIHSFSVPSLNLKMDAIPGRLNHLFFCPSQHGSFIGYCAELCGVNHSIMPIVIEVIDVNKK